jgi:hypothetical protein
MLIITSNYIRIACNGWVAICIGIDISVCSQKSNLEKWFCIVFHLQHVTEMIEGVQCMPSAIVIASSLISSFVYI